MPSLLAVSHCSGRPCARRDHTEQRVPDHGACCSVASAPRPRWQRFQPASGQRARAQWRRRASQDEFPEGFPQGSPLLESPVVQQEVDSVFNDMKLLMGMLVKWPQFDVAGKLIFIERMEAFDERLQVLLARFRLAKDPVGDYVMAQLNRQFLEMSSSWEAVAGALKGTLNDMREIVKEEDKIQDPTRLRAFREEVARQMLPSTAPLYLLASLGKADLEDPAVMQAMADPQALAAFADCMQDGSHVARYADRPALHRLLLRVFMPGGDGQR